MRSDPPNFPTELAMPFAWYRGEIVSRGRLWRDVAAVAGQLPARPYAFNLCENRYLFCVSLLAMLARRQICLLPPTRQSAVIEEIAVEYPGVYVIAEQGGIETTLTAFHPNLPETGEPASPLNFDWQQTAVVAFTSGSTGRPKPCGHRLATFKTSADMAVASLGLSDQQRLMISTAPPQHMYGLETSVFWPLFSSLILYDGRPLYAEDIRRLLQAAPWSAILASTPAHLRTLQHADGDWRRLQGIVSATDHLSPELAEALQAALGVSVKEIYGSTETLSFACRETRLEAFWQPYRGCRLYGEDGVFYLESPHLPAPASLQDGLELQADGGFKLLGRQRDMIKIAGKRASLTELNRRLCNIEGVADGFCYLQPGGRLAAVVVAAIDKQAIRAGLSPFLDEVFLPRKIHFVSDIPRNATGKLLKADVERLLAELG